MAVAKLFHRIPSEVALAILDFLYPRELASFNGAGWMAHHLSDHETLWETFCHRLLALRPGREGGLERQPIITSALSDLHRYFRNTIALHPQSSSSFPATLPLSWKRLYRFISSFCRFTAIQAHWISACELFARRHGNSFWRPSLSSEHLAESFSPRRRASAGVASGGKTSTLSDLEMLCTSPSSGDAASLGQSHPAANPLQRPAHDSRARNPSVISSIMPAPDSGLPQTIPSVSTVSALASPALLSQSTHGGVGDGQLHEYLTMPPPSMVALAAVSNAEERASEVDSCPRVSDGAHGKDEVDNPGLPPRFTYTI